MKGIAKIKLILTKRKFRRIYQNYHEYMGSHDGSGVIVDYISSTRLDMCRELNELMKKMCDLEFKINGNVPLILETTKFK